jgi:hypothetical protein
MVIDDFGGQRRLVNVGLGLTRDEALELRDTLDTLLADPDPARHEHVSSADYQTELTVWIEHAAQEPDSSG